ncbi:hypothetical protein [Mycobacterium timonense]|uniref:Uncharacterized protein n=1 Tax=Mycobacterium timonense TaxID=701043 RepID=A0ABX3TSL3_9MYCO|nr:hypothetical protein [Mycobacterium timonense]ORB81754.1 hypothetical protein BST46_01785 [Mycobacterium timonense]
MTAPNLGPCWCEVIDDDRPASTLPGAARYHAGLNVVYVPHEHSDFEPYPCAEFDCTCRAHQPPDADTEPAENQAKTAAAPRNHASLTVPRGALEFATQNATQAAAWIDGVLAWAGSDTTRADDPAAVCDFADALEALKPEGVDVYTALAVALRRLAATRRDSPARGFVAGIRRKVAGR